jgi:alpha-tubulin suppressor-like RCC1 family protein
MKTGSVTSVISNILAAGLAALAVSCSGEATIGDPGGSQPMGTVQLALLGQGNLGNQYQLSNATFAITGQVNATVAGDPNVVSATLPAGVYTVTLQPGWTLSRVTAMATTAVTATLASPNPQTFVINGSQTTTVSWLFNVSGPNANAAELEVVAVSPGSVSLLLGTGEVGWNNFSPGSAHTCAVTTAGALKCWGANESGQLGYGDATQRLTPPSATVSLGVGRTVARVVVSRAGSHSCALLDDATVKCWGLNSSGQLGYGDSTNRTSPPAPVVNLGSSNTAKTIAVSGASTCAILDTNLLKCWGSDNGGQLGYSDGQSRTAPSAAAVALGDVNAAKSVEMGLNHTCVILADNTVKCWGTNSSGQLGYGDTTTRIAPAATVVNLGTGRTAKRIAAGFNHTCAILDDNTLKCWGANANGQLGYGDAAARLAPPDTPVNLGTGRTALLITAGNNHTCALLDDGSIKCWGINSSGQLGYEDTNQRSAPAALAVNIGTGRLATRLLAGQDGTCVLLTDNAIKCWGVNTTGLFGIGGTGGEVVGDQLNEMGDRLPEVLP